MAHWWSKPPRNGVFYIFFCWFIRTYIFFCWIIRICLLDNWVCVCVSPICNGKLVSTAYLFILELSLLLFFILLVAGISVFCTCLKTWSRSLSIVASVCWGGYPVTWWFLWPFLSSSWLLVGVLGLWRCPCFCHDGVSKAWRMSWFCCLWICCLQVGHTCP